MTVVTGTKRTEKTFARMDGYEVFFPRIARLAFLLTEINKPYAERSPEVTPFLGPKTKFDMTVVTVGKRSADGRISVDRCDMVGLASLDPYFQRQGLSPSFATLPGADDMLDLGGVMLFSANMQKSKRVSWKNAELCAFFGLGTHDWMALTDLETIWNRLGGRVVITPVDVLEVLDQAVTTRFGVSLGKVLASVGQGLAA